MVKCPIPFCLTTIKQGFKWSESTRVKTFLQEFTQVDSLTRISLSEVSEWVDLVIDLSHLTHLNSLFQVSEVKWVRDKSTRVDSLHLFHFFKWSQTEWVDWKSTHFTRLKSIHFFFFKKLPFLVLNNFYSVLMLFFASWCINNI